jgi:phosphohistidine phosphatase
MSKTLYLMRHGAAETPGMTPDEERNLTFAGLRQVRHQAVHIFKTDTPDRFLVSNAVRTHQTMDQIIEELSLPDTIAQFEDELYNATVRELLEAVNGLDELWKKVCIIGHNPAITYLAEYLTGQAVPDIEPAGVVSMTLDAPWTQVSKGSALFNFYRPPHEL